MFIDSQAKVFRLGQFFFIFQLEKILDILVTLIKQIGGTKKSKFLKCKFPISNNINISHFTEFLFK